jgi:hypothetical protein
MGCKKSSNPTPMKIFGRRKETQRQTLQSITNNVITTEDPSRNNITNDAQKSQLVHILTHKFTRKDLHCSFLTT